jgi:hypothetical protein
MLAELSAALQAASSTTLGQKALNGHAEDFQLEIAGHEPIHVEVAEGRLSLAGGPSPRREPMHFTRVQLDEPTLRSILDGRLSPVEAMSQGKLLLRTRLYGGALITILLRAAYDLARERRLAAT